MKIPMLELIKYPLPSFLNGRCEPSEYYKWLNTKAITLLKRDQARKRPYALIATKATYKGVIHNAVTKGSEYDPYTGERLDWELIDKWDTSHDQPEGYKKLFALMPTVDHINSTELKFEICSWKINDAKADLNPEEFINLCKMVVKHGRKLGMTKKIKNKSGTPLATAPRSI